MTKNIWIAAILLISAITTGCAKGGSGPCAQNCPAVTVTNTSNGVANVTVAGVGLTITFTGMAENTSSPDVNWTITGTSCSGAGNPCGSFSSTSGTSATYVAPAAVPSTPQISIVATSQSDTTVSFPFDMTIVPITADVAPTSLSIGQNLTQQFTAVALPDNAQQTFTWTCTANGVACQNFTQDPNVSGLAYYVAQDNCGSNCVQISAAPTIDPTGCSVGTCTIAKASVVNSRLTSGSTKPVAFSFHFAGFDNNGNQVLAAGTFAATNGTISSGVEDETTLSGGQYATTQHLITGGAYTPINGGNVNSNNSGTLTLTTGAYPNQFQAVLDGAGDIQMIESDGHGSGSGVAEPTTNASEFNSGDQTFAFGFTGVDASGNRVGYAGLMPINGSGVVTGGMMDTNDNGNTTNICGTSPCGVTGTYTADPNISGLWHLTLTSTVTLDFDFYIANGNTNANTPLTLYAISTDPVDATHPAVLGTMVLQDSKQTYNNADFNGTTVSALSGVGPNGTGTNVSLTLASTDGNGNFGGQFDQNNAGTILTYPSAIQTDFAYTYAASATPNGRYTFQMLGNPGASPVVAPVPFILYASGQNRGFLLDQSSTSVMTGTMNPQPNKVVDEFAPSALPGTYALTTNAVSNSSLASTGFLASNLLLTSTGNQTYNVAGTQNPGSVAVAGSYNLNLDVGAGTITLTAPAARNYVIYLIDFTHFFMIDEDPSVSSPLFYAEE